MNGRLAALLLIALPVLGAGHAVGYTGAPTPLPDKTLYARIAAIPETELTSDEMAAARRDEVAEAMVYLRCAKLTLEDANACTWLTFTGEAETGVTAAGALEAMILGLRQGALPTHTDLFSRYGGSAALADMLLFDRPLQPEYAALIEAADGEYVLQAFFRKGALNAFMKLVQGEPSSGLDAMLLYLFREYAKNGSDNALIRLIELGPAAVNRFHEMHELRMFPHKPSPPTRTCARSAEREYRALVKVLSATGHPALSAVQSEPWPDVRPICRADMDYSVLSARDYGVRTLNRVRLAVGNNISYRRYLFPGSLSPDDSVHVGAPFP